MLIDGIFSFTIVILYLAYCGYLLIKIIISIIAFVTIRKEILALYRAHRREELDYDNGERASLVRVESTIPERASAIRAKIPKILNWSEVYIYIYMLISHRVY